MSTSRRKPASRPAGNVIQMSAVMVDAKRLAATYDKPHFVNNTRYGYQASPEQTEDSVAVCWPNGGVGDL